MPVSFLGATVLSIAMKDSVTCGHWARHFLPPRGAACLGRCPRTRLSSFLRGLCCHFTQTGTSVLSQESVWLAEVPPSLCKCGQAGMSLGVRDNPQNHPGLSLTLRKARDIRLEESGAEKGNPLLLLLVHPKNWCELVDHLPL